jgi:hypothetical protein
MPRQERLEFHTIARIFPLILAALVGMLLVACANRGSSERSLPAVDAGTELPPMAGAKPDLIFETFIQAVNAGNIKGAASLLTDDINWEGPRACEEKACSGRDAARRNLYALVDAKANWIRGGGDMQGNFGVMGLLDMSQSGQGGTPGALYLCTVQIQDGRIQVLQMKRQQI